MLTKLVLGAQLHLSVVTRSAVTIVERMLLVPELTGLSHINENTEWQTSTLSLSLRQATVPYVALNFLSAFLRIWPCIMSELLTLHIGGFGTRVGYDYWKQIAADHCVTENGTFDPAPVQDYDGGVDAVKDRITTMFDECPDGRYKPRSIFIDLEPGAFDSAPHSMFDPSCFFAGKAGTDGIWAIGHCTNRTPGYPHEAFLRGQRAAKQRIEVWLEPIRKSIERCDRFHGFQHFSSFGGGTGSGLGTLLARELQEEYRTSTYDAHLLFPSLDAGDTPTSIYNTSLSVRFFTEYATNCMLYQNKAVASHALCGGQRSYDDINTIIAAAAATATSSYRLAAQPTLDSRRLHHSMTPFPRLHYYIPCLSRVALPNDPAQAVRDVLPGEDGLPPVATRLCGTKASTACHVAATVICRSNTISTSSLERECRVLRHQVLPNGKIFNAATPLTSVNTYPRANGATTALSLLNTSAIASPLKDVCKSFTKMFQRRVHLHYYTQHGVEEYEIKRSLDNMTWLVEDYQRIGLGTHELY